MYSKKGILFDEDILLSFLKTLIPEYFPEDQSLVELIYLADRYWHKSKESNKKRSK